MILHALLAIHDLLLMVHCSHAIWVHLLAITRHYMLLDHSLVALLLRNGTVLVGEEKGLELDDFFPQLLQLGL